MEKNKNNNTPSSTTLPTVPTLSAPGLWDSLQGQHGRLSGDAAFVARLRAEKALSDPDPGPILLEYLRFAYLAWTIPEGATPSQVVDEVWHTHILFTRSYERFCFETKGTILHHDPGGGVADESRFRDAYLRTLDRYEAEFGPPPSRYWPRPAVPKPEPPRAIPKPAAKPTESQGGFSSFSFLLLSPVAAAFTQLLTGDVRAALWGAVAGAVIGFPAALIGSAAPIAAQPAKTRPTPSTKAKRSAATASGSGSSSGGDDGGASIWAAAQPGHTGGHGHGDHGGGSHGDGGSSGGDSGGGSSCGSSCGGGGCGGG